MLFIIREGVLKDDNYHEDLFTNYDRDEDQGNEKVLTQKKSIWKTFK